MHALASLLDESVSESVRTLWRRLEESCGLTGIRQTPIPHLSWMVAETLDFAALDTFLPTIARKAMSFVTKAAGIGVFTGARPVLYVPVLITEPVLQMHGSLWDATGPYAQGRSVHYAPGHGMPHITLAHDGLDGSSLLCALRLLVSEELEWVIRIDNLALIYQESGQVGKMHRRFEFVS